MALCNINRLLFNHLKSLCAHSIRVIKIFCIAFGRVFVQYYTSHHHHHVQEGLGLIPVPCILKMKLVSPSLPRSSYMSSSFWFIL